MSLKSRNLLICLLITFFVFSFSLFRAWIFYDEYVIYDETYAPIPTSFNELLEIIRTIGLKNNFGSSNFLYSSTYVIRTNFIDVPIFMLVSLFIKKTAFLYHLLNLVFHLINTSIIFIIFRHIFNNKGGILAVFLTLLWSIHPTQIESIILSSNYSATLTYIIFFLLFYDFIKNNDKNTLVKRKIIIPIIYLFTMMINEYSIVLPIILLGYSFFSNYAKTNSFSNLVKNISKECFPYISGLMLYVIYFIFANYTFSQTINNIQIKLIFEIMLWFTPQIIVHYLKLIFFPKTLSIDQTAHVHIGTSIFDPYSIFCILFVSAILFIPLIVFLLKRKWYIFTLTIWLFFLSLMPFSQFLSATYCLAAERYLYTPLFILIFGFSLFLNKNANPLNKFKKTFLTISIIILFSYGIRSIIRINDWKNDKTLLEATIQTGSDALYKGYNIRQLAQIEYKNNEKKSEGLLNLADNHFKKVILKYSDEKNYENEPVILKAYGLDHLSKTIKAIYLICMNNFTGNKKDTEYCLNLFKPYLKYLDTFDPQTLELYANLLIDKGDLNAGKDIFLYAYKKYPMTPFLLVSLIRFERDIENNLQNAEKYLIKARNLFPYSKDILFEAVRYYQKAGNLKEYARHSYLYGLRAHSKFTYLEALTVYLMLEDLNNAKKTMEKLLKIDPADPKVYYLSGSYYIKINDYKKAISQLEQGYSFKTNDDDLSFKICSALATLHVAQNDFNKATLYTQEALKYTGSDSKKLEKVKELMSKLGT